MKLGNLIEKNLFLSIIIIILGTTLFLILIVEILFDESKAINQEKIFMEINNDSLIKNEIGYINRMGNGINVLVKSEISKIEYKKMIVRGSKGKYAVIEYWVNKNDSIWNLDSLHVLKISDKPIKYKK